MFIVSFKSPTLESIEDILNELNDIEIVFIVDNNALVNATVEAVKRAVEKFPQLVFEENIRYYTK